MRKLSPEEIDHRYPVKYKVSGHLPAGWGTHPDTGEAVGAWCIINPSVSEEEATSGSTYARPRVLSVLVGTGSYHDAHELCALKNADQEARKSLNASREDPRWRTHAQDNDPDPAAPGMGGM